MTRGIVRLCAVLGLLVVSGCGGGDCNFIEIHSQTGECCICDLVPNDGDCDGSDVPSCDNAVAALVDECVAATTARDFGSAYEPCSVAAEHGNIEAQHRLGMMYDFGYGITEDDVRALMWLNLSAALGKDLAPSELDNLLSQMTPGQIDDANRLTSEWLGRFRAQ